MAKLYEYAVIYQPPKAKDGEKQAEKATLIVDVKRILAESDQEVSILASRSIPEDYIDKLENVQIVVRPF
jgi:hypothetical protein